MPRAGTRGGLRLGVGLAVVAVAAPGASSGSGAPAPPRITQIVTGYRHTCAITSTGRVKCWGANVYGQLGNGSRRELIAVPVDVVGLTGVTAITAGAAHTCALTRSGGVKCWGDVDGHGAYASRNTSRRTPVNIPGLTTGVREIAAGGHHTCVLMSAGGVKCWGLLGQRREGSGIGYGRVPADVRGLPSGLRALSGGSAGVACVITTSGGITCWDTANGPAQGAVPGRGFTAVTIGSNPADGVPGLGSGPSHICALTSGGGVQCWGSDSRGELGNGSLTSGVRAIDAGSFYTCAVTSAGGAKCWGYGGRGQLGNGTSLQAQRTPVEVTGLGSRVVAISASGYYHTCALTSAGRVKCWGSNTAGQLGNGRTRSTSTPVDVVFR